MNVVYVFVSNKTLCNHLVCKSCMPKINKCPLCRSDFKQQEEEERQRQIQIQRQIRYEQEKENERKKKYYKNLSIHELLYIKISKEDEKFIGRENLENLKRFKNSAQFRFDPKYANIVK